MNWFDLLPYLSSKHAVSSSPDIFVFLFITYNINQPTIVGKYLKSELCLITIIKLQVLEKFLPNKVANAIADT